MSTTLITKVRPVALPDDDDSLSEDELGDTWVAAAPFRAHLRYLCATSSLAWPTIAVLAGISLPAARGLLIGRAGRPVRRVSPEVAHRLLGLTVDRLRLARRTQVPAEQTIRQLRVLVARVGVVELGRRIDVPVHELRFLLADPPPPTCWQPTAAAVTAAARQAGRLPNHVALPCVPRAARERAA